MKKILTVIIALLSCGIMAKAQKNEIMSDKIASLQVVAGDDWLSPPVIVLGEDERINIAFDDLTHEYHRYVYKLEHCEADWTVSKELFQSDYCDGFADGNTIDNITESINTNVQYSHYTFQIPNEKCKLKIGGNYRVTIYDENSGDNVASACFMVVEPRMSLQMAATTNTDIDTNGTHQQVEILLNYGDLKITNPRQEIKTIVTQNGRWDNAVINAEPQFFMPKGLKWQHSRSLIFDGGNEYRKFEALNVSHTTMGLESVNWDGNNYHAYVWTDEPRPNYVYDEDANGAFYIRNSDNVENNYTSEYVYVHFRLKSPRQNGNIYINGAWTNNQFSPQYKMEYNEQSQCYENVVKLKQGYYSYQYLLETADDKYSPLPSEGNFYQTENIYRCMVYYRGMGQRTDRLMGYAQVGIN